MSHSSSVRFNLNSIDAGVDPSLLAGMAPNTDGGISYVIRDIDTIKRIIIFGNTRNTLSTGVPAKYSGRIGQGRVVALTRGRDTIPVQDDAIQSILHMLERASRAIKKYDDLAIDQSRFAELLPKLPTPGSSAFKAEMDDLDSAWSIQQLLAQEMHRIYRNGDAPKWETFFFILAMFTRSSCDRIRLQALSFIPTIRPPHFLTWIRFHEMVGRISRERSLGDRLSTSKGFGGRGMKRMICNWFLTLPAMYFAYIAVKYKQREGWELGHIISLVHITPTDVSRDETQNGVTGVKRDKVTEYITRAHQVIISWLINGLEGVRKMAGAFADDPTSQQILRFFESVARFKSEDIGMDEALCLIREQENPQLSWEMANTRLHAFPAFWDQMLRSNRVPIMALARKLGILSGHDIFSTKELLDMVIERFQSETIVRRNRLHPIFVLTALRTYSQGKGEKSDKTWPVFPGIVTALERCFFLSFNNVELPEDTLIRFGIDCSGSMGVMISGVPNVTSREFAGLIVLMYIVKSYLVGKEPNVRVGLFARDFVDVTHDVTTITHRFVDEWRAGRQSSSRTILEQMGQTLSRCDFGSTNPGLVVEVAINEWRSGTRPDKTAIIVVTDNDMNTGMNPMHLISRFSELTGAPPRCVAIATEPHQFSIFGEDPDCVTVCGADTSTLALVGRFISDGTFGGTGEEDEEDEVRIFHGRTYLEALYMPGVHGHLPTGMTEDEAAKIRAERSATIVATVAAAPVEAAPVEAAPVEAATAADVTTDTVVTDVSDDVSVDQSDTSEDDVQIRYIKIWSSLLHSMTESVETGLDMTPQIQDITQRIVQVTTQLSEHISNVSKNGLTNIQILQEAFHILPNGIAKESVERLISLAETTASSGSAAATAAAN